ncbi:MAG: hypothetical protein ABR543_02840 [Gemmatimonadaceae bacterium]
MSEVGRKLVALAMLLAIAIPQRSTWSQRAVQVEARADAFLARSTAVHIGAALSIPASRSIRLGLGGGIGSTLNDGADHTSGRVEGLVRFVIDPYYQQRWAPYAVAGLSARYDRQDDWYGVVFLLAGVEGPRWAGFMSFAEAGLGGGTRLAVGFRRSRGRGR